MGINVNKSTQAMEVDKLAEKLHLFLCPSKSNRPVSSPALQQSSSCSLHSPDPPSSGSHRSSPPNLLLYPSPQLQQEFPGDPQDTLTRKAGRLIANFDLYLLSKFDSQSHPQFCSLLHSLLFLSDISNIAGPSPITFPPILIPLSQYPIPARIPWKHSSLTGQGNRWANCRSSPLSLLLMRSPLHTAAL